MYKTTQQALSCTADICTRKNKVKAYQSGSTVHLKDGQEFEILLGNWTTDTVAASISINGKLISTSKLVLKPGQKVYLERFLDDSKKFLFETYKVDNTEEAKSAIENNGNVEIKFYKEQEPYKLPVIYNNNYYYQNNLLNKYNRNSKAYDSYFNPVYTTNSVTYDSCLSDKTLIASKSIETGRIDKGSESNQKFQDVSMEFASYPFQTINIKILPFSHKPLEVKDLAEYCTECGTKNRKGNYKFCPRCGNKFG
jgi:hypothetical protein